MTPENKQPDVVIVGAGPAGLSAATWCCDLGLSVILLEKGDDIGGQLHLIHGPIHNYLGLPAKNGQELLSHFRRSVAHFSFEQRMGTEVLEVDHAERRVRLRNEETLGYGSLIIATGVRRRRLEVPGEIEFRGKGIVESGARDKELLSGKRVLVVGGGDAAAENALMISEYADSVKLVHRRPELTARNDFWQELQKRKNVEMLFETVVTRIDGPSRVSNVELRNLGTGNCNKLEIDAVLIRIGVTPNTEFVRGVLNLDDRGYIKVTAECETNVGGIFAVGDAANPISPTITTATGSGAVAAKASLNWRKMQ